MTAQTEATPARQQVDAPEPAWLAFLRTGELESRVRDA